MEILDWPYFYLALKQEKCWTGYYTPPLGKKERAREEIETDQEIKLRPRLEVYTLTREPREDPAGEESWDQKR
ncbi:hypothetical protein chiPu_0004740 [Chiloscyllium punctatum]|uniref:Uncharacterized protein n=1 Tax=Chiloscyllium punctatum TaxID=137246 RepID=A0A401S7F2_CHIPU|nr:hypothetical protein [Chiloscyllium punctatum]